MLTLSGRSHLIIEASSNGRTQGFDPCYRGSNPCASAIFYLGQYTAKDAAWTVNPIAFGLARIVT